MSDCFVLYLLLICMKKKKSGAGKFTNNNQSYMKQATQQWSLIYEIVKANCTVNFEGATPYEDAMELLLKSRERRF